MYKHKLGINWNWSKIFRPFLEELRNFKNVSCIFGKHWRPSIILALGFRRISNWPDLSLTLFAENQFNIN